MTRVELAIGCVALTFGIAGCTEQRERTEIIDAKKAIEDLLTDPASAQFREVAAVPTSGAVTAVCGEVNAKNKMGGYAGFQKFYVTIPGREAYLEPDKERPFLAGSVEALKSITAHTDFLSDFAKMCWDLPPLDGDLKSGK